MSQNYYEGSDDMLINTTPFYVSRDDDSDGRLSDGSSGRIVKDISDVSQELVKYSNNVSLFIFKCLFSYKIIDLWIIITNQKE